MKTVAYTSPILFLFALNVHGIEPFERRPEPVIETWQRLGTADTASLVRLKVVLPSPHDEAFEERVLQIATPFSGYYRKHLSASELADWTEPLEEHVSQVLDWLSSYGVYGKQNHDLIEATTPVSRVQRLLNTTYYHFKDEHGRVVRRTDEYYGPAHIARIIDFVHPTVNFPKIRHTNQISARKRAPSIFPGFQDLQVVNLDARSANPCDAPLVDPACVEHVYNVDYTPPVDTNVSVDVYLGLGTSINKTNLQIYLEHFNVAAAKAHASFTYHHIGKVYPASSEDQEQDLDMQMTLGHGWPVKASYTTIQGNRGIYQWGPRLDQHLNETQQKQIHHYEEAYVDYLHSLAYKKFMPAAVTTSEDQNEHLLTPKYMRYICKIFGQIASRGVTALTASGDSGSDAVFDKTTGKLRYLTLFPPSCPYITTVGSTVYADGIEKAVTYQTRAFQGQNIFASGGGFSIVFPRPKYQDVDIPKYLKDNDIVKKYGNISLFNANGRGYPDIAAFGSQIAGVSRGKVTSLSGTSASSPIIAALVGRLAAYEQSKGRPPLGFLNPLLYEHPELLNDIDCCGNNNVNDFFPKHYKAGYPVTKGWNAVTGLGSIHFAKIRQTLDEMAAAGALD